jgi:hypothetical protein
MYEIMAVDRKKTVVKEAKSHKNSTERLNRVKKLNKQIHDMSHHDQYSSSVNRGAGESKNSYSTSHYFHPPPSHKTT